MKSSMNPSAEVKIRNRDLLRMTIHHLGSTAGRIYRDWQITFWMVLLWLLAIPLSTICFFSMLFWAYGVDG